MLTEQKGSNLNNCLLVEENETTVVYLYKNFIGTLRKKVAGPLNFYLNSNELILS